VVRDDKKLITTKELFTREKNFFDFKKKFVQIKQVSLSLRLKEKFLKSSKFLFSKKKKEKYFHFNLKNQQRKWFLHSNDLHLYFLRNFSSI